MDQSRERNAISHGFGLVIAVLLFHGSAVAQSGQLARCERHFYQGAPPAHDTGHEMSGGAQFVCKGFQSHTFFALSYNGIRRAPDWVAYRLGQDRLGPKACRTKSRMDWRTFFGMCRVSTSGKKRCSEVFFSDHDLQQRRIELLGPRAYSGTGFDRGHQAPAAAFGWHACGWFRTFTMANMSPQRPNLNRKSWKDLEDSTRYWAVTKGEVFVVTGPIYVKVAGQHPWLKHNKEHVPHLEHPGLETVKSKADIPTASYKVIVDARSEETIAFVIPNGSETLPWRKMAVKVSLVEKWTGLRFSIPEGRRDAGPNLEQWPEAPSRWVRRPCADGSGPTAPEEVKGADARKSCLR